MTRTLTACPACRTVVPPGQERCLRCGHLAAEPSRSCPACGRPAGATARFCPHCGQGVDRPEARGGAPSTPADTTGVFLAERSYRTPLLAGAVVLALLAGLAVTATAVEYFFYRPQSTVSRFFAALEDRDAQAARRLLNRGDGDGGGVDLGVGGGVDLLDPGVLESDGYIPPTDARVEEVRTLDAAEGAPETSVVEISFALAGGRHTTSVALVREESADGGLFRRWLISGGVYPISISAPGLDEIVVAGRTIPIAEFDARAGINVLPGGYRVTGTDNPLLTTPEVVAYAGLPVSEGDDNTVRLTPEIKPESEDKIDSQVRAYLDDCARSTTLTPQGCPLYVFSFSDPGDVRWSIDEYPVVALRWDPSLSDRVIVFTETPGRYSVTWVDAFGADERTGTFEVSGTAVASGGDVLFEPGR